MSHAQSNYHRNHPWPLSAKLGKVEHNWSVVTSHVFLPWTSVFMKLSQFDWDIVNFGRYILLINTRSCTHWSLSLTWEMGVQKNKTWIILGKNQGVRCLESFSTTLDLEWQKIIWNKLKVLISWIYKSLPVSKFYQCSCKVYQKKIFNLPILVILSICYARICPLLQACSFI